MVFTNRDWAWERQRLLEAFLQDLDFFGGALEHTSLRDHFWGPYQRLANAAHSLRQAVVLISTGNGPSYLEEARFKQLLLETAVQLAPLTGFQVRYSYAEVQADQPSPRRFICSIAASWDAHFTVLRTCLEEIRLAHVASPTGEMDQ